MAKGGRRAGGKRVPFNNFNAQPRSHREPRATGEHLSMLNVARSIEHSREWTSPRDKLRNIHMKFISGGIMTGDNPEDISIEQVTIADPNPVATIEELEVPSELATETLNNTKLLVKQAKETSAEPREMSGWFYIDSQKERSVATGLSNPIVERAGSTSSENSETSEEIVLFTGRKRTGKHPMIIRDDMAYAEPMLRRKQGTSTRKSRFSVEVEGGENSASMSPVSRSDVDGITKNHETPSSSLRKSYPLKDNHRSNAPRKKALDDAQADYISNLKENDHNQSDDDLPPTSPQSFFQIGDMVPQHGVSSRRSIKRFDSVVLSTEEEVDPTEQRNERLAVTFHAGLETSRSEDSLVTVEQAARDLRNALAEVSVKEQILYAEASRVDDEKLAFRLAKQEEFGMNTSELLLFGGDLSVSEESPDLDALKQEALKLSQKARKRDKREAKGLGHGNVPMNSFHDLADDPYGNYDLMDRERVAMRINSRNIGRRPIISDSELDESLQLAWQHDRRRKKVRKQEREALRAQGLLGNEGKADIKAKYSEGMTLEQISMEIELFVQGHASSLSLPPMDKRSRKVVHEFAHALNLKSKSLGAGQKRFPCLYRTSRTLEFDTAVFNALRGRFKRQYLPNLERSGPRTVRKRRAGASAAATYQDGDIVGAAAPEIGVENRGRAMLEKMGWSNGTALGAENNKGMLQPVIHIVKKSRAGLG